MFRGLKVWRVELRQRPLGVAHHGLVVTVAVHVHQSGDKVWRQRYDERLHTGISLRNFKKKWIT